MELQRAYEQWRLFPPDQLTFSGSREVGRMYSPGDFPPRNTSFSTIGLDPVYGGSSTPYGGACELITSYLICVPNFGESLRVINLIGQCVSAQQIATLFNESLYGRLPKLKSASFRIFTCNPPQVSTTVAPPELEHLEVYFNMFSHHSSVWLNEALMPLIRKVKHLGWFRLSEREYDLSYITRERLPSLKTLEIVGDTSWHFGAFPSALMPTLERIIVHNYQFSYSMELQQIYRSRGQPFELNQAVLDGHGHQKNLFCNTTAILRLEGKVDSVEGIQGNRDIRELTLCLSENSTPDRLELRAFPLMETLVNLEKLYITTCFPPSYPLPNFAGLHNDFLFPSVGHLQFIEGAAFYNWARNIPFLRIFPNLHTLVNPPIECLTKGQIRGKKATLQGLRKLVFTNAHTCYTKKILTDILQWQHLDALFLQYRNVEKWPPAVINGLKKHRGLRHVCVVATNVAYGGRTFKLPSHEKLAELAEAWCNRDWRSMFFIRRTCFDESIESTMLKAIHHGDGIIEYELVGDGRIEEVILEHPEFYTLFWQHIEPELQSQQCVPDFLLRLP